MKKIYLFSFIKMVLVKGQGERKEKFLILFYPYKNMSANPTDIFNQLREYFQFNILPDKIIILCGQYNEKEMMKLFEKDQEIYNSIPLFTLDDEFNNISINSLQVDGTIKTQIGFAVDTDFFSEIFTRGMVKIFHENGGLIVSQSAHHFVFPSGKHSDKFLRPGNVLIKGIQINFLAFALYRHLTRSLAHDSQLGLLLSHLVFFERHNSHATSALFRTDVFADLGLLRSIPHSSDTERHEQKGWWINHTLWKQSMEERNKVKSGDCRRLRGNTGGVG